MSQRGVELFDTFLKNIAQYKEGDFSSTAYPFDTDQPVYIGELIDPKRQGISLKYAFYVLVNESDHGEDNLFKQYSLVNPLRRHKDDPNFIFRLETGLRDLFSAVRKLATQQCKNRRLKITSIGLSIPSQWTLDFEDAYRRIIIDVFGVPRDGIFFHTETEALAHFLLQDHRALLLESGDEEGECDSVADYEVLLFLDFGGHNMNGCIFNVVYGKERDQNKDASFYGISEPFGAGGGSEHWAYNIGELFLRKLDRFPGYKITHRERQKQLEWFHRNKDCLGPLQELEMIDFGGDMDIDLLPEEINNCFEQSVEEILNIAKSNIEMVSQLKGVTPVVVVSGGTAKHVVIKRRLKDICSKNGIQKLRFVADLNIENDNISDEGQHLAFNENKILVEGRETPMAYGMMKPLLFSACRIIQTH
ncbi:uncharacterized protein CTRU02_204421 [Colletotrichum truncatum]|uniref:Uncharacterized protein n=1 Tax=Colletotrichum truncatum TaxID=5467 RepID=A0ACC3ZCK9_COLTU